MRYNIEKESIVFVCGRKFIRRNKINSKYERNSIKRRERLTIILKKANKPRTLYKHHERNKQTIKVILRPRGRLKLI